MLIRNATWNLLGQILPLFVAVVAVPVIIKHMGTEGFGLISIIWTLIGYFSLFDFGLGRALTKYISVELESEQPSNISNIISTGLLMLLMIGLLFGLAMWLGSPWLISHLLNIKQSNPAQIIQALQLTSLAIPFVLINVGLRAILEGYLRFNLSNTVRIPFGIFTLGWPAVAAYLGHSLPSIVIILFAGIFVAMIAYIHSLHKTITKEFISIQSLELSTAKKLIVFGGWVSISNFIGPIIFYADRFIISAILSVSVMTYYVAPYEVITKTLFLSSAIAGSFFPIFAKKSDSTSTKHMHLMLAGARIISIIMFTIMLVAICFGHELLNIWVGEEIAINGTLALQILSVGVFFNAIAYLPFTLIQASGRADLIAKLHIAQLPIYIVAMWTFVSDYGLTGASLVWMSRALFEMIIFFFWTRKTTSKIQFNGYILLYILIGLIGLALTFTLGASGINVRILAFILILIISLPCFWSYLLYPSDRMWIHEKINLLFRSR